MNTGICLDNIDLNAEMPSHTFLAIQNELHKNKVVILKKQSISDEQYLNFALQFGAIFQSGNNPVLGKDGNDTDIVVVGNQAKEYKNSYLGHQEVLPHSDHQWIQNPSSLSMLYAIDVDKNAAPTTWANMALAYSTLDESLKDQIKNVKTITYNPFFRPFGSVSAKYVNRNIDIPPGEIFEHPLVRTHPITQEKILYMHRAYEMEFQGMNYDEGLALWYKLNDHIDNLKFKYTHEWEIGDLVIWDNRATIHYRPPFAPDVRRVLKRISISGERPF
jgi:taurine dioxygenase